MATVPGQPMEDGGIPKELQPTQADLLMAAAIMHQQGKFQVAASTPQLPASVEDALTAYDQGKLTGAGVRKVLSPTGWDIQFGRGRREHQIIDPAGNYHWERDIR